MTLDEKMESDVEKLAIKTHCQKRNLFQRIFKIEPMHEWQARATNRYGLTTYEVCLRCGSARERNGIGKYPTFIECERINEFDRQFDEKGNYIFNDKCFKQKNSNIIPTKTVEEVEDWCKRQLDRKCNK